jgi:hypothetical protein
VLLKGKIVDIVIALVAVHVADKEAARHRTVLLFPDNDVQHPAMVGNIVAVSLCLVVDYALMFDTRLVRLRAPRHSIEQATMRPRAATERAVVKLRPQLGQVRSTWRDCQ